MTDIQSTYCSLLQQAIGLSTPSLNAERSTLNAANIDALVHLAQIQGTAPLIYNEILKSDEGKDMASLKQVCMQNMMHQQRLMAILRQTFTALSQGGIQTTLLKGFGLAQTYPQPYLRTWGDLDVYVGPNQYHQAAAILRDTFPDAKHHDEEWEELKHYNFVLPDGNVVEMHRNTIKMDLPCDRRLWEALEQHGCIRERIIKNIENIDIAIPESKFNMLFTFLHAWEHFVESGVGMKQLCDVALLAHEVATECRATRRDYDAYMRTNLGKLRLMQPWQLIGYVCVTTLGLPKSEWPLYEEGGSHLQARRERFFNRVMQEGCARPSEYSCLADKIAQREKTKQMNIIDRKWLTFKSRFRIVQFIYSYSPRYALHLLYSILYRGIRRTLRGEKMIDY